MSEITVNFGGQDVAIRVGENTELAAASATAAQTAETNAELAEVNAEAARDIALAASIAGGNVYATKAAGLTAVAEGETFWSDEDGAVSLYRDVAGVATLLATMASDADVTALEAVDAARLIKQTIGETTTQSISTNLSGDILAATLGPLFLGPEVIGADGIIIDAGEFDFPPGVAFRTYQGTPAAPTVVTSGQQLGYLDFRGYNSDGLGGGAFYNAGSLDVLVDSALAFGAGQPPRTFMRLSICWNDDQAQEVARLVPYAADGAVARGGALWVGYIPANAPETPLPPRSTASPRFYSVTHNGDWAAVFDSRFSTAQALGVRFDLSRNNNDDYFAAFAYNSTIIASIRGDGMGMFTRMRLGRETDPVFGAPTLAIANTVNDYCFTAESRPATGAGYAARFHTEGATASDYLFIGSAGAGSGATKFSVTGSGVVDALAEYRVNGTKVVGAQGAAVTDGVAAAAAPTKAEFDALVTQFNALLARCRAHGLIAT